MEEPKPERKKGFQRDPGDALMGPGDQVDMGLKGCEESGVKRAKKRQAFLRRVKEKKKRGRYPPHSMGEGKQLVENTEKHTGESWVRVTGVQDVHR